MKKLVCLVVAAGLFGCSSQPPSGGEYPATNTPPVAANTEAPPAPATSTPTPEATPIAKPVKTKTGLQYQLYAKGKGEKAKKGDNVFVHYTGRLTDGTVFDSSLNRGVPIDFQLGTGRVIAGWEEGIEGMQVGEKRRLTIPPDLGYGDRGAPPVIPPGATLVFDVELVKIEK